MIRGINGCLTLNPEPQTINHQPYARNGSGRAEKWTSVSPCSEVERLDTLAAMHTNLAHAAALLADTDVVKSAIEAWPGRYRPPRHRRAF